MTTDEFIKGLVSVLIDKSLTVKMLNDPKDLEEQDPFRPYVAWYQTLNSREKELVEGLVRYAERLMVFQLLCVLDGALAIVDNQSGDFELQYVDGDRRDELPRDEEPLLHDLLRAEIEL
jgi:hypothetical protein